MVGDFWLSPWIKPKNKSPPPLFKALPQTSFHAHNHLILTTPAMSSIYSPLTPLFDNTQHFPWVRFSRHDKQFACSQHMNISNSNALKSHHSLTTQEVHLSTSKEGYENLIFTIVLIFLLHLFLSLIFFPVFLTICTNYRYSLSTLNKLSVKLISCLFDIVAVAGAVKEVRRSVHGVYFIYFTPG